MFCSNRFLSSVKEPKLNDLLGVPKITVDTLKDVTIGSPLNFNTWRQLKSRLMFNNDNAIYLKVSSTSENIIV